jgi:glycosyltransferase involved in cell wall biosynthesis
MPDLPENYNLTIAGEVYGTFNEYQKIITSLGLEERVHLHLKYIPDEDVKLFFSMADVVALPYRSATQSGIVAIAKHFSKPVVATDVGGLSEFIVRPSEGEITNSISSAEIARSIRNVVENDEHSEPLSNSKPYSWEQFAQELLEFAESKH